MADAAGTAEDIEPLVAFLASYKSFATDAQTGDLRLTMAVPKNFKHDAFPVTDMPMLFVVYIYDLEEARAAGMVGAPDDGEGGGDG
jgi:hypothetical protein